MKLSREEAHKIIDRMFDASEPMEVSAISIKAEPDVPLSETPKDKRVIRTKSTGDRVYLIDETAKTKAWVTTEDILTKLGFTQADVQEVDDSALVGYAMTASIYKVD